MSVPRALAGLTVAAAAALPAHAQRGADPFVLERDAAYTVAFGDQYYGAIAAGPGEYFAVWVDLRTGGLSGSGHDLYGQRIGVDGTLGAPGSLVLLRDSERDITGVPAVAWNGACYLVAWYEGSTLFGMRLSAAGEPFDEGPFVISGFAPLLPWPAIASDGDGFLVVGTTGGSVIGARVSGDGVVLDPTPLVISSGASALGYPKVAFGAGEYVVAWAQAPAQAIRAARVLPDGTVLDPGGVNVSGGGNDVDAHIDFDGTNFYIDWLRRDATAWDLYGVHLSPGGAVVGMPRLLLDGNSFGEISGVQMAFNGQHHLIAITTGEPLFSNFDLYALRVDATGAPVGGPFPVSTIAGRSQVGYGVASVGSQFFIVWEGNRLPGVFYVYDTEGARIDGDGVVLDTTPVPVASSAAWQIGSATSFDGDNFLCVFEDWREGPDHYEPDLFAVRVSPRGEPVDEAAFLVAGGAVRPQTRPDVAFGAGQHAVVYENSSDVAEIRLVRILPDGTVLDPGGRLVFANEPTGGATNPQIAWNGEHYAVAWYDSYLFPGQQPLQFALVRPDGTRAVGPVNIPGSDSADLLGFDLASDGDGFALAWADLQGIKVTRLSAAGAVLGTTLINADPNRILENVRIGWSGGLYLVAWNRWPADLRAQCVDEAGSPVGAMMSLGSASAVNAAVAVVPADPGWTLIAQRNAGDLLELYWMGIAGPGQAGPPQVVASAPREEIYAGTSAAASPAGVALAVQSLWADNPYNAPRAQGRLFAIPASCPADFDGDGALTPADFSAFRAAFLAGDASADFDGDTNLTPADFSAFRAAFLAGCG